MVEDQEIHGASCSEGGRHTDSTSLRIRAPDTWSHDDSSHRWAQPRLAYPGPRNASLGDCHHCANMAERSHTDLDGTACYMPRLHGLAYRSWATNKYSMSLLWAL